MRSLFDVNALLALLDSDHTFHVRVRTWWSANKAGGWATCPITQNGFARIMSQRGYPNVRTTTEALEVLRLAVIQPGHDFWPDDISITDPGLFDHTRILGPKQITDVYLLGLAVKNGGRLVTLDDAIPLAAVRGARKEQAVVV